MIHCTERENTLYGFKVIFVESPKINIYYDRDNISWTFLTTRTGFIQSSWVILHCLSLNKVQELKANTHPAAL